MLGLAMQRNAASLELLNSALQPVLEPYAKLRSQILGKYIYVIELKLRNNGGMAAAKKQIVANQYLEPFKANKRKVIGLAVELDEEGKGLIDWEEVD